ncbi:hypothetical protein FQN55_004194 [Onygenales sp. PD_40]|nr:hypothetical protein FQN55_004194 [Onygenales sp. PD_40]
MAISKYFSSSSAAKAASAQRGGVTLPPTRRQRKAVEADALLPTRVQNKAVPDADMSDRHNQGNPGCSEATSDEDDVPQLPSRRGKKRRFVVSDSESEDSAPKRARRPASPPHPSKGQSGTTPSVKAISGPKDKRPKASPTKGLRGTASGPKGQGSKIHPDLGNTRGLTAPRPGTKERTRKEANGFLEAEGGMTAYIPSPAAEATKKRGFGAESSKEREEQTQEFSKEDLEAFIACFGDNIDDVPAAKTEEVEDLEDEERG